MGIECGICSKTIGNENGEGGPITALACGHLFHENCANALMIQGASCPHCRKRISRTDLRRVFMTNVNRRQSINPLNSTMVQNFRELQEDLLSVQTTNDLLIENQKIEIEQYKQELAEKKYEIEELMDQLATKDEKIPVLERALEAKDDEVNDLVRERDMLRGKTSVR